MNIRSLSIKPPKPAKTLSIAAGARSAALGLIDISASVPIIGALIQPVAYALKALIVTCDHCKCNKEAFSKLQGRLCDVFTMYFGPKGFAEIASQIHKTDMFCENAAKLLAFCNSTAEILPKYCGRGFFRALLVGNAPATELMDINDQLSILFSDMCAVL